MSVASAHRVQMRWRDLDALGHVNHPVVLTYLEEGRDAFLKGHGIGREEYVVGSCSVRFAGALDLSFESVLVECTVSELGRSSLTTTERIVDDHGDVKVEAEFGLVLWDPARRAPRPISDEERASLRREAEGEEEVSR